MESWAEAIPTKRAPSTASVIAVEATAWQSAAWLGLEAVVGLSTREVGMSFVLRRPSASPAWHGVAPLERLIRHITGPG
jgi:hypothetical protein